MKSFIYSISLYILIYVSTIIIVTLINEVSLFRNDKFMDPTDFKTVSLTINKLAGILSFIKLTGLTSQFTMLVVCYYFSRLLYLITGMAV